MWRSPSFYCCAGTLDSWNMRGGRRGHPHSPLSRLGEYAVMLYIVIQPPISYRSSDKMGQVIVSRSETCISQHRAVRHLSSHQSEVGRQTGLSLAEQYLD